MLTCSCAEYGRMDGLACAWMHSTPHQAGVAGVDIGSDLVPQISVSATQQANGHGPKLWHTVLAGGLGGMASRTGTAPLETIKLAAQTRGIKGVASEARAVIAARGMAGLWAGNVSVYDSADGVWVVQQLEQQPLQRLHLKVACSRKPYIFLSSSLSLRYH